MAEGDKLVIKCVIDAVASVTNASIYFKSRSDNAVTLLKSVTDKAKLTQVKSLVELSIENITATKHTGQYTCAAYNALGSGILSESITVVGE